MPDNPLENRPIGKPVPSLKGSGPGARLRPQSMKHKLTINLLIVYLLSSLATVFALYSLSRVEVKLNIIESLGELSQKVLETRRHEKNYLLYGNDDDLLLAFDYLDQALAAVNSLRSLEAFPLEDLPEYESKAQDYADSLHKLKLHLGVDSPLPEGLREGVHLTGHIFTTYVLEQDDLMRRNITSAALQARRLSQITLGLAFLLGIFLIIYLIRRIVGPLEFICTAAASIAAGKRSTIPMVPEPDRSREEIELVNSLNIMLRFLETKQDQLVQSAKLATIGKVSAGIAHEINNPLNNIYLTAEVLLEDLSNIECDELLEMINDILSQADRAREVVYQLLVFSRTQESTTLEKINLIALVEQTLVFLKNQIRINQVSVHTEMPEQPIKVSANANHLQQVLVNIILNGIQAMGSGGLLSIKVSETPEEMVRIEISDNGPGIPEEVKTHIFDPFFTTKSEGTGLGLSVSNSIIESYNGKIVLDSQQGRGTTFFISLPVVSEEDA